MNLSRFQEPSVPPYISDPNHDEHFLDEFKEDLEPSAPPLDNALPALEGLTYDEVVYWWNALDESRRCEMQAQGKKINTKQIAKLREYYQAFFPKEYYPREVYTPKELSACDYYLLSYFWEEMAQHPDYSAFSKNEAFSEAFMPPPPSYNDQEPPSYQAAQFWWESLPQRERDEIQGKQYTPQQIRVIRREYRPYYRFYFDLYDTPALTLYDYYLLSCYSRPYYSYSSRLAASVASHAWGFAFNVGQGFISSSNNLQGRVLSGGGRDLQDKNKEKMGKGFLLGLILVMGVIVAAVSAVVGGLYTGIKATVSVNNLLHGKKVWRSLWRLGCMAVGAYVGAMQGAALGAMVGSIVPGIGTITGAIVGAAFGAPILAAVAGVLAKHTVRFISWCRTGATNNKWNVSETEHTLNHHGVHSMNTVEIQRLFQQLRNQKNEYKSIWNPCKGALIYTHNKVEKDRYNQFLEGIKQGLDPCRGIRVDKQTRFRWDGERHQLFKEKVELPALKSGLKR